MGSFEIFHLGPAKKSFKNWRERERERGHDFRSFLADSLGNISMYAKNSDLGDLPRGAAAKPVPGGSGNLRG